MEKAAGVESGGRRDETLFGSGLDGVAALPVSGPGGSDRQAHLLAQGAGDEAPDRMRVPAGCLHDLLQAGPTRPLQQIEDLPGLAALTRNVALGRRFGLRF